MSAEKQQVSPTSIFGFINANKPAGMTSRDLVNVVQRRVRPAKVGHAGTLDPLAEGVLVIAVGPAVRLVPYVQQTKKRYRALFRLGESSPTGDLEQTPVPMPEANVPTATELKAAAAELTGEIDQKPPAYSAIWVDGKRAHERVRRGEEVEMPTRRVTVHSCDVTSYEFPDVELQIVCGSGTYVRSVGIDLADRCGTAAVMTHLTRISVGNFGISDAVSLDELREKPVTALVEPASRGVEHLPRLQVDAAGKRQIGFGQCLDGDLKPTLEAGAMSRGGDSDERTAEMLRKEDVAVFDAAGELCALVRRKRGQWCPYRVFFRP